MKFGIFLVAAAALIVAASFSPVFSGEKSALEFGVEIRERAEARFDFDLDSARADDRSFVLQRLRLEARFRSEAKRIEVFAQLQDSRTWGEEPAPDADGKNVDLHQGYVRIECPKRTMIAWFGRQELVYGDSRLVGNFDWSNVGRSFDAARVRLGKAPVSADLFAARVRQRSFFDFTGADGQPGANFLGAYATFGNRPGRRLDGYAFYLHDGLPAAGEVAERGADDQSRFVTLGARGEIRLAPAKLDVTAEAAGQTGDRATDNHRAFAAAVKGVVSVHEKTKTAVVVEFDYATGDSDPSDGQSKEFHNLYPTNHLYYGYMDLMGWRNTESFRAGLKTAPEGFGELGVDIWALALATAEGRWTSAGGAVLGRDVTGGSGRRVGTEADFTWKRGFRGGVGNALVGYSFFVPGKFAEAVRGDDTQHFAYVQVLVRL